MHKLITIIFGILLGIAIGYSIIRHLPSVVSRTKNSTISSVVAPLEKNQVIGFLPYWLISKAKLSDVKYLTTLTYFGLTIAPDGSIQKFSKPGETDPGWLSLKNGNSDKFFDTAKKNNADLSLLVFSGDEETIYNIIDNPVDHARNLINEVGPIMKSYGFSDLNLDVESVNLASPEARVKFTTFAKEVKKHLDEKKLGTLTIDVSPTALIRDYLIDMKEVEKYVDKVVLMTYDFHYSGSTVTGPVSPIGGVPANAEYDTETSVQVALQTMPAHKIFIGMPLYGYEWETVGENPRSSAIPGTGITASNNRVEDFLKSCTNCKVSTDQQAKEEYLVFEDEKTGTYHQIFYPDAKATQAKMNLANKYQIEGLAIWALGYGGDTIMEPLKNYNEP